MENAKDSKKRKIIAVPPIKKTTEVVRKTNVNIPGDIKIDKNGLLMKSFFEYDGFTRDNIESFNAWFSPNGTILNQIQSQEIKLSPTEKVIFRNVAIYAPTISMSNKKESIPLLPKTAREKKMSYSAFLYIDMDRIDESRDMQITESKKKVFLGRVPIMMRSQYDKIATMTPTEILEAGEDHLDPGGYFIINGTEKVVLMQKKLRENRILLYNYKPKNAKQKKSGPVARMTCSTINGTVVVAIFKGKNNDIRMTLSFMNDEEKMGINIFQLYRLYGMKDLNETLLHILKFTKPKWRQAVKNQLGTTINMANDIVDDINYMDKVYRMGNIDYNEKEIIIREKLDGYLFPQMNKEDISYRDKHKLDLFSLMVVRYVEFLIGLRQMDDQDDWSVKQIATAGASMERLFGGYGGIWNVVVNKAQEYINTYKGKFLNLDTVASAIKSDFITDSFNTSFNSTNWGVKGSSRKKENITDVLKNYTLPSLLSHVTRINAPLDRKSKVLKIRLVQMSQLGYIDPVESPDGANCGLVEHKASTCWISINRDDLIIRKALEEVLIHNIEEIDDSMTKCILNGKFIGWLAYGEETRNDLLEMKRSLKIHKDICIVFHESDNILYIHTDGGRPTRPLLLVNPETHKLIIDEKQMWSTSEKEIPFEEYLRKGVIEYLDPWEQEQIKLAQYSDDIIQRISSENESKAQIDEATQQLENLKYKANVELSSEELLEIFPEEIEVPLKVEKGEFTTYYTFLDKQIQVIKTDKGYKVEDNRILRTEYTKDIIKVVIDKSSMQYDELQILYKNTVDYYNNMLNNAKYVYNSIIRTRAYTHAEMDPTALLSIVANLTPYPNHNQAPRNSYSTNMIKQALGVSSSNQHLRFDTSSKNLAYPSEPLGKTQMEKFIGLENAPIGQTAILAIMTYTGFNQEDSIIVNKASLERGLFRYYVYHSYVMIQNNRAGEETFTKPQPPSRGNINEQKYEEILLNFKEKYKHLDDRGVAKLGSIVKSGDIVITKIRTNKEQQSTKIISLKVPLNESGTVDRILITTNKDGNTIVRVRIRSYYMHIEGDKLASRTAQKSTIGLILPPEDMPFTSSGIIPDMILNPHAIPSRMTIGKLMEMMMSKLAVMKGERFNVTGFRPFDLDELRRNLLSYGYIPHGTEVMYSGTTGRKFNAQIFMGPVYYMALKHLVRFKIQQRQLGPVSTDTGQPVQGKQSGGGIRVGEMERDALISHGASNVIQDRLCLASDVNKEVFCINCGRIAISNYIDKKYKCKTCGDKGIFGTSEIPRAFKLLMDILAGMGIELKLGFKKT